MNAGASLIYRTFRFLGLIHEPVPTGPLGGRSPSKLLPARYEATPLSSINQLVDEPATRTAIYWPEGTVPPEAIKVDWPVGMPNLAALVGDGTWALREWEINGEPTGTSTD